MLHFKARCSLPNLKSMRGSGESPQYFGDLLLKETP